MLPPWHKVAPALYLQAPGSHRNRGGSLVIDYRKATQPIVATAGAYSPTVHGVHRVLENQVHEMR